MATGEDKKKVAVKKGVYTLPLSPEEKGHIIGSRCKSCGTYFYPTREVCAKCYAEEMEEVALSSRGKIWSYTVARQAYPGTLLTPPFIAAYVELPEKVWVQSLITDVELDAVKIGTDVELYFFKAAEDEEKELIAFAFRPVSA